MFNAIDPGLAGELEQERAREKQKIVRLMEIARQTYPGGSAEGPGSLTGSMDRRTLLKRGTVGISSLAIAGTLQSFMARRAHAQEGNSRGFAASTVAGPSPYGDPVPTPDEVTGLPLIGLPPGFRYWSHGWTGDPIFAHLASPTTPPLHDGMGVLAQAGPLLIICRNHEAAVGPAYVGGGLQYSPQGAGGNTNLLFDTGSKRWLFAWPTLSGTVRNCGGGITPHGTWLSGEETDVVTQADPGSPSFTHGWVFEVPAIAESNGKPIKAMGRRSHEAAAVDPQTGFVYLTEDTTPGGVYRFKPNHSYHYQRGGALEVLKIVGMPNVNLRGANPQGGGGADYPVAVGAALGVEWVPIEDPENLVNASNYAQGAALGAANFRRPEGTWYADGHIYFVSTDGGQTGNGQVFALDLANQTLTLIYDSPSADALDNPDNVVVTPRGGLLFCEDNSGAPNHNLNGVNTERLVALTRDGQIFTFANNLLDFTGSRPDSMQPYTRPNNALTFDQNYRGNEWAGATFDKSGEWLFVNIQTPGITFAITGPWRRGPL